MSTSERFEPVLHGAPLSRAAATRGSQRRCEGRRGSRGGRLPGRLVLAASLSLLACPALDERRPVVSDPGEMLLPALGGAGESALGSGGNAGGPSLVELGSAGAPAAGGAGAETPPDPELGLPEEPDSASAGEYCTVATMGASRVGACLIR